MMPLDVLPVSGAFAFAELKVVLSSATQRMRASHWRVDDFVDVVGEHFFEVAVDPDKDVLRQMVEEQKRITFAELESIARELPQVIWASFFGYDGVTDGNPWVILSAVDSSYWRFETDDMPTRNWVNSNFDNVRTSQS